MNHKARAAIAEYRMLKQGDRVAAAVSGGADSVALLDFLCSLTGLGLTVRACHLNHCLRGEESDRDEQLVRTMCREYGVELAVKRVEVKPYAASRKLSVETAARQLRYAFFEEVSRQWDCKIATAHTLSDAAETVLLNLARGTGLAGLCGIPAVRGRIIRPLIGCTRQEVEDYCQRHGLCYVTDSSNLTDAFARNRVRHQVLPQLERENPRAAQAIGRMSALLRQDRDYLEAQAAQAARELARGDGLDAAGAAALHPALQGRVLAGLLARQGIECSAQRVRALEQLLGNRRRVRLTGDWYAVVRRGVLRLEPSAPAGGPIRPRLLPKPGLDGLWVEAAEGKWLLFSVINCADYENFENISSAYLNLVMDYDKITGDILLRARQPGDRIRPAGRGCSKDLRRAFSELALLDRERLCVLADQEGILCAEGVGIDQRVSPDEGSGRLLRIALCGEDGRNQEKCGG